MRQFDTVNEFGAELAEALEDRAQNADRMLRDPLVDRVFCQTRAATLREVKDAILAVLGLALFAALLAGCNLIIGVGELHVDPPAPDARPAPVEDSAPASPDARHIDAHPPDAAPPDARACVDNFDCLNGWYCDTTSHLCERNP
jgi:hypothetical protein